jgi:hypothetical protein
MDVRDYVAAIVHDRGAPRRAQRDVKYGSILRNVDFVTPEHGIDAVVQARFSGELKQQPQCFAGDPVLGIVEI